MATTFSFAGVGNLTAAPEIRLVGAENIHKLDFTIAARRSADQSDFLDCTAWRGTADFIAKYFDTGDSMFITGDLCTESYTDKNGVRRKRTWVNVHNVGFAGAKRQRAETAGNYEPQNYEDIPLPDDVDMPF